MIELYKLLTDFLFKKGYLVRSNNLGIRVKFNNAPLHHGLIRLHHKDTNILGLVEPKDWVSIKDEDWGWTEIGNRNQYCFPRIPRIVFPEFSTRTWTARAA